MQNTKSNFDYASLVLTLVALVAILKFELLVAMLAASATYLLARGLPHTWLFKKAGTQAPLVASLAVAAIPVLALGALALSLAYLSQHAGVAYAEVLQELTRIVSQWRTKVPEGLAHHLPTGPEAVKLWLAEAFTNQAEHLTYMGKTGAHGLLMAVVGSIVGLLLANGHPLPPKGAPLARAIRTRAIRLVDTFKTIVVAQFWIALINTILTAVFFYVMLPLLGEKMPYAAWLLALTFVSGMLPVVGNLICNTITTIMGLTAGPTVAISALIFLILIHKLEYAINAKVVGTRMQMAAWELLVAMFSMEALFGVPGLVAAPFFYAYVKVELRVLGWV